MNSIVRIFGLFWALGGGFLIYAVFDNPTMGFFERSIALFIGVVIFILPGLGLAK